MPRCEDFPCCGHYDESDGASWCPDDQGRFGCAGCGTTLNKRASSSLCQRCLDRIINCPEDGDYGDGPERG